MTPPVVPAVPPTTPEPVVTAPSVPHGRTAQRLTWDHLPPQVRALVERHVGGGPVVESVSQGAGFTPGFASRVATADGGRAFVKAASRKAQRPFADAYAEEARKLRLLAPAIDAGLPAPRLLWSHEDDLWVVLGLELVDGRPPRRPWQGAELAAALDALEAVADLLADPPEELRLQPLTTELPGLRTGWDHVRATDPGHPHLEEAAALAARFDDFPGNDRFTHSDVRDDNVLLTRDGRAYLCDWNWPVLGPVWMDTVDLLVSAYGDGLDADALLATRRLTRDADPDHLDAHLAQLCGFMLEAASRPVPPHSPFLRVHARWYAEATWRWLASRREWS